MKGVSLAKAPIHNGLQGGVEIIFYQKKEDMDGRFGVTKDGAFFTENGL